MEKDIVGYQEHVSILMEQMKPSVTTQDEVDALEVSLDASTQINCGRSPHLHISTSPARWQPEFSFLAI